MVQTKRISLNIPELVIILVAALKMALVKKRWTGHYHVTTIGTRATKYVWRNLRQLPSMSWTFGPPNRVPWWRARKRLIEPYDTHLEAYKAHMVQTWAWGCRRVIGPRLYEYRIKLSLRYRSGRLVTRNTAQILKRSHCSLKEGQWKGNWWCYARWPRFNEKGLRKCL